MPRRNKNPLHPSALTINDINVGRRIIRFNLHFGIMLEAEIISRPFVHEYQEHYGSQEVVRSLVVDTLDVANGQIVTLHLSDMGVIPYSSLYAGRAIWHSYQFTIDARKKHLLPKLMETESDRRAREWENYLLDDLADQLDREAILDSY